MIVTMLAKVWSRHWYLLSIVSLTLVAGVLRLYQLGAVPAGLTWDEAAIAYNGYAVITARRDEWLHVLPISFLSYGDFKAPLAIYVVGLFVTLLGSQAWVVRLPFALAGILAIPGFVLLTQRLLEHFKFRDSSWLHLKFVSLLSGMILTFSPWHHHFSRVGFESGLALAVVIWGVFFIFKAVASKKPLIWFILGSFLLAASLYTYHSTKIVVPVLGLALLWLLKKNWRHREVVRSALIALVIGCGLVMPLLVDSFLGQGGGRFSQASLFGLDLSWSEKISQLWTHFLAHFSLDFLIHGQTDTLRHGDGRWGVLFITTASLGVIGVVSWLIQLFKRRSSTWLSLSWFGFALFWIGLGIVPAAIGRDVPHSNRALLALPGFVWLALGGLIQLVAWINSLKSSQRALGVTVVGMLILLQGLLSLSYLHHYYTDFAKTSADDFKAGYVEMFQYVVQYEEGLNNFPKVYQVIVSSQYGQPYMYALFVKRQNPIWYRGGALNTYLFVDEVKFEDLERPKTVVVSTTEDIITDRKPVKEIIDAAGKLRFKVYYHP